MAPNTASVECESITSLGGFKPPNLGRSLSTLPLAFCNACGKSSSAAFPSFKRQIALCNSSIDQGNSSKTAGLLGEGGLPAKRASKSAANSSGGGWRGSFLTSKRRHHLLYACPTRTAVQKPCQNRSLPATYFLAAEPEKFQTQRFAIMSVLRVTSLLTQLLQLR